MKMTDIRIARIYLFQRPCSEVSLSDGWVPSDSVSPEGGKTAACNTQICIALFTDLLQLQFLIVCIQQSTTEQYEGLENKAKNRTMALECV